MGLYRVVAVVSLKKGLKDPEAETIQKDLVLRHGYSAVKEVRVGKQLTLLVEAESPEEAISYVKEMCDKLMIYNPVIHELYVTLHA
ncbi:MAG: phosphoribosylformylglycinamidine synthase subunit PurS [Sulfolobales archaeon]|nr:phosphoribosylformylglycinamidine synthase subunit PurS [Sulfolobales archaeon]MDW8011291.1 phosphoribosylformylglycinamidine synthase subunit PurS [Sulfolobales archaeon]